ncbi:hypothetical protein F4X88_02615 [Candidatus Poribacteria bacterium]|nr:hypothetical protein [Candidatus Poribacteria bacterium]MYA55165.1 hypothetical protein [Candidatus Poribacteria bacterium]
MSYINYSDTRGYYPSENLQNLFEKTVLTPFRESLPEEANEYERDINWEYKRRLREDVLERGSTDFDQNYRSEHAGNYTPEQKVLLYCATYMPMHLYSAYHFYSNHLRHLTEYRNIVFIDFGCGPLTSGIAFWAATAQGNITYIGVEKSEYMLNKAREILKHGPDGSSGPFFNKARSCMNYEDLSGLLDGIEKGNPSDTLILFNFSYVLASLTFQGEINALINVFLDIVEAILDSKIAMVYQNIRGNDENWKKLKESVMCSFPGINFIAQNDMKPMHVIYERLMERTVNSNLHVSCDYFCFQRS